MWVKHTTISFNSLYFIAFSSIKYGEVHKTNPYLTPVESGEKAQ